MDREIHQDERRRAALRRALPWAVGIGLLGVALWILPDRLRPSVSRQRLRTGVVDVGPVEDSLQASGTVVPAFEKVHASPFEARILLVLRQAGDPVAPGDALVELDLSAAQLAYDRAEEELARRRDAARSRGRTLTRAVQSREAEVRERELELELAAFRLGQQQRLHDEGLSPGESLREAEVGHERAALALERAQWELEGAREEEGSAAAAAARELELLEKERAETARLLELGVARADRAGVVTWIAPQEGAMVGRGEEVARVADLSRFGVEGRMAAVIADRLVAGLPVRVEIDRELRLTGLVSAVDPTIEEGAARFRVELDEPSHPRLRNHLRVDVWVAVERRADVVRVPKGPFAAADGGRSVLVVEGDRLRRRHIVLGLTGIDHYEVEDGLLPGEEVVLSDLNELGHLTEIPIR